MIEAVIFDMDGLLVDSEPVWDRARLAMARKAGKTWTTEDHKAIMGASTAHWVAYTIRRLELTASPEVVEAEIMDQMVAHYEQHIPFLEGAIEAVHLVAKRYPIGLASGSPRRLIDSVTRHPDLKGCFGAIISSDQVAQGKPAPDVYLRAAATLGADPHNCVCLEDSGNGIQAGKNAGMKVIAVPDARFPPEDEVLGQADLTLSSLTQLRLELIEGLEKPSA
jgi:HAD superfamily hydrolase (TIGR01509 family)